MGKKVACYTLGCKVNQYETQVMTEALVREGFQAVNFTEAADLYVINSCSVTNRSNYQSRQAVRRAIHCNPNAFIIATGCYAQQNPPALRRIAGIDLILGNAEKGYISSYVTPGCQKLAQPQVLINTQPARPFLPITYFQHHTRPFVKIQDGCNFFCSYCIIPYLRGRSVSRPPRRVMQQLRSLIAAGYQEIVLVGIHLGMYGKELPGQVSLTSLLKSIIKLPGLGRIRLGSMGPAEFTEELMELLGSPKICPHLHISLQSADDEILQRMNRRYKAADYRQLIERLVTRLPDAAIGADVIVGFPGENEAGFQRTYQLLQEVPLAYLHIFTYSPRPGTKAATFPDQINGKLKKEHYALLRALSEQKSLQFRQRYLNKTRETLILNEKKETYLVGLTDNYIKIFLPDAEQLVNKLIPAKITHLESQQVFAQPATAY